MTPAQLERSLRKLGVVPDPVRGFAFTGSLSRHTLDSENSHSGDRDEEDRLSAVSGTLFDLHAVLKMGPAKLQRVAKQTVSGDRQGTFESAIERELAREAEAEAGAAGDDPSIAEEKEDEAGANPLPPRRARGPAETDSSARASQRPGTGATGSSAVRSARLDAFGSFDTIFRDNPHFHTLFEGESYPPRRGVGS